MQLYGAHPPVCLSQHGPTAANPLLQVSCCGPGRQDILINCCTAGTQQQPRTTGECGQCHVVGVRGKLVSLIFTYCILLRTVVSD